MVDVVFSVCLELLWGYLRSGNIRRITNLISNIDLYKKFINKLLFTLNELKIPVTWATVGGLFIEDKTELLETLISIDCELSTYIKNNFDINRVLSALYGYSIINNIVSSNIGHEIGYHTYTHRVLCEYSKDVAEYELYAGVSLAKKVFGLNLKSFIFPSNNICHIDLLKKYGIKVFRGYNIWRVCRVKNFIAEPVAPIEHTNGLVELPTSMLFDNSFPSPFIKGIICSFSSNKGILHISFHPESFAESKLLWFQFLAFLRYVSRLRSRNLMDILTMGELSNENS